MDPIARARLVQSIIASPFSLAQEGVQNLVWLPLIDRRQKVGGCRHGEYLCIVDHRSDCGSGSKCDDKHLRCSCWSRPSGLLQPRCRATVRRPTRKICHRFKCRHCVVLIKAVARK